MKTFLTIVPITPFEANALPISQYDCITIERLTIGDSGIEKCKLTIGDNEIQFALGNYRAKDMLVVNGNLALMPSYKIIPNFKIEIVVELPHPQEFYHKKSLLDIQLCCYLHSSELPLMV